RVKPRSAARAALQSVRHGPTVVVRRGAPAPPLAGHPYAAPARPLPPRTERRAGTTRPAPRPGAPAGAGHGGPGELQRRLRDVPVPARRPAVGAPRPGRGLPAAGR